MEYIRKQEKCSPPQQQSLYLAQMGIGIQILKLKGGNMIGEFIFDGMLKSSMSLFRHDGVLQGNHL